ncbi:hypothetical protein JL722_9626 [Aureococcus anophagefferens]|nr:hypothetical protein JL722_9626 [Aureococcus anophagefferens]
MAWQQALAPVAFWVVFTIGRRFVGQWLLNARRAAPAEEEEAPATASAPKDAKNAKEATVTAPKNAKKKKKPPEAPEAPKSAKRHDPRGGLAVCGVMVALAAAAAAYAHRTYGPEFFVSPAAKTLGWSAGDWRAALENRTVAFVGGQHARARRRSGGASRRTATSPGSASRRTAASTSARRLRAERLPAVRRRLEFLAGAAVVEGAAGAKPRPSAEDGVGRYALAPPGEVYWTEAHDTVHGESQEQALVDYVPGAANRRRNAGLDDETCEFPDAEARAGQRFVFVTRHPLATALSTQKWCRASATLLDLWAFLGLDATRADAAAAAAAVDGDPNAKHRDAYCAATRSDQRKRDHAPRGRAARPRAPRRDLAGWCA